MSSSISTAFRLLLPALVFVTGCSDPYEGRNEVSGAVKLKNEPIKDGAMVEFVPLENQGTGSSTTTKNGSYKLPRSSGLKPGKYLVRVSLGDGKTAINPIDGGAPPGPTGGTNIVSKELVPRDWNVASKQERIIKDGEKNVFDFDIH